MADNTTGDSGSDPRPARPSNGSAGRNGANMGGNMGGNGSANGMNPQALHGNVPHSGQHHQGDIGTDGLMQILKRQWYVVVLSAIACVMLALLYLLLAKPVYTAVSTIRVKPLDPSSIASNSTAGEFPSDAISDFLDTECVVIRSDAVLALAMDKIRDARTLKGQPHPLEYVKAHLLAAQATKGQAIEVAFDSKYPEDARLIVDSVVQAYKEYESNSWKTRADEVLDTLTQGSENANRKLTDVEMKIHDLQAKQGFVPDMDPTKNPAHMEVMSLTEATGKAHLEFLDAQNAYRQATNAIIGDAEKLKEVDAAEQRAQYSSEPKLLLQKYQDQLGVEQARLADDGRRYLPNHPVILQDQARIDDLIVRTVVVAKAWEELARQQYDADEKSLADAEQAEVKAAEAQRDYVRLELEAEHLKRGAEDVENRISQIDLTKGAGALNINVLDAAALKDGTGDVKPARAKTLGIGLVLGVIFGLALGCLRDWTDDRMRSPHAVKLSAGAPLLGAIPVITTAYNAADRGQIVHHDPFGDAAESYRTLRTALQFGLPAGVKTILITSPVSGDGKSTFVSNLAIAMAQANKRVLIVDADLRAPMQHRLFGLKDRMGLATILGGTDTLAQAIQQTDIDRLDVLPCGPTPSNPSELLNSPAFNDVLNELADKYDLVVVDSPPVTAVADARILAASTDVSLLVIRLDSSTRKQTEAARDGLRSVGGRLVGVAVNGVSPGQGFHAATAYSRQIDSVREPSRSRRAAYSDPESRSNSASSS